MSLEYKMQCYKLPFCITNMFTGCKVVATCSTHIKLDSLNVVSAQCEVSMTAGVHCVSRNDTDVAYYNFNALELIFIIFGRDVTERVCY